MVYIISTTEFEKSIEKQIQYHKKIWNKIEELRERKKLEPNGKTLSAYSDRGWIVKWNDPFMGRIVLEPYRYNEFADDQVFFIRKFYSDHDYEWMRDHKKIKDKSWFESNPLSPEEITEGRYYIKKLKEPQPLPKPPADIVQWLTDFRVEYDFCIYESEKWVKFAVEELEAFEAEKYITILKELVDNNPENIFIEEISQNCLELRKATYQNVTVIFEDHPKLFNRKTNHKKILIHYGGNELRENNKICEAIEEIKSRKIPSINDTPDELISKYSFKAYPNYVLDDIQKWLDIQKKPFSSNISLSPDQIKILNEFNFPKFINGQAGSGKTTMLYYLFAEILFWKKNGEIPEDQYLIYLTENKNLLKSARKELGNILLHNVRFNKCFEENEIEQFKKECFSSFDDLLFYHLLEDEDRDKFSGDYVDFKKFKELYNQNQNYLKDVEKKFSSEIVWFIITTFIKGYSKDNYLTPVEFELIPEKDRLHIDFDTFRIVYEKIWIPWYKRYLSENNCWDRQDLVRHILSDREKFIKNYLVIFSDESQDFTKIELQLIFKLSSLSNYDLSNTGQIPLLFAGDPFQTVNPTGFNISNIKRMFSTELEDGLKFSLDRDSFFKNLKDNYRSSEGIVRLSNIIQYFRYKYLQIGNIPTPQRAKKTYNEFYPYYIDLSILAGKIQCDVIIIPCERGDEENFIKEYPEYLSPDYTVLSSTKVKGDEFDKVIVFGFGEYYINEFRNHPLEDLINDKFPSSPSDQFRIRHFFNKLYVSITRAREDLVIIDTKDGLNQFWHKLIDERVIVNIAEDDKWSNILKKKDDNSRKDITILERGTVELLSSNPESAKAAAEQFKESGELLEDPEKMAEAARIYKRLKAYNESDYCKARELQFRFDFKNAGKIFLKIKKYDFALNCFWLGGCWEEILDFSGYYVPEVIDIYSIIAKFMTRPVDTILELYDKNSIKNLLAQHKISWKKKFDDKVISAAGELKNKKDENIEKLISIINELVVNNDKKFSLLADLYFISSKYEDAVRYWDRIDKHDHKDYYEAKLVITKDDKFRALYLSKLGRFKEIVGLYKINPSIEDKNLIINAFIKEELFAELINQEDLYEPKEVLNQLKNDDKRISKLIELTAKSERENKVRGLKDYSTLITYAFNNILTTNIQNEIKQKGGISKIDREKYLLLVDSINLIAYSNSIDDKSKDNIRSIINLMLSRYNEIRTKLSLMELLFAYEKYTNYDDLIKKQRNLAKLFKDKKVNEDIYIDFKLLLLIMLYKANFYTEITKHSPTSELIGDRVKIPSSKSDNIESEKELKSIEALKKSIKLKYFDILKDIENENPDDYEINIELLKQISTVDDIKSFRNLEVKIDDIVLRKIAVDENEFKNNGNEETAPVSPSSPANLNDQSELEKLKESYYDLKEKYDSLLEKYKLLEENMKLKDRLLNLLDKK